MCCCRPEGGFSVFYNLPKQGQTKSEELAQLIQKINNELTSEPEEEEMDEDEYDYDDDDDYDYNEDYDSNEIDYHDDEDNNDDFEKLTSLMDFIDNSGSRKIVEFHKTEITER